MLGGLVYGIDEEGMVDYTKLAASLIPNNYPVSKGWIRSLPEQVMRDAYKRIYDSYQPGPVMDFKHYPEHFQYHHGNADDGQSRCTDYAGEGWRSGWSSATAPLVPGSERFTLQKVGPPGSHEKGASTMVSGAQAMEVGVPAK